jgi:hypothetical protein
MKSRNCRSFTLCNSYEQEPPSPKPMRSLQHGTRRSKNCMGSSAVVIFNIFSHEKVGSDLIDANWCWLMLIDVDYTIQHQCAVTNIVKNRLNVWDVKWANCRVIAHRCSQKIQKVLYSRKKRSNFPDPQERSAKCGWIACPLLWGSSNKLKLVNTKVISWIWDKPRTGGLIHLVTFHHIPIFGLSNP